MLETLVSASEQASTWISALAKAIENRDERALGEIFQADSHWRNLSGISWPIATFSGQNRIARELPHRAAE